jgi:hypothetical protein
MQFRRIAATLATLGFAFALSAAPASAHTRTHEPGTRSLAAVLTADGDTFDRNWNDYDIVTEAVLAVAKAKPGSPVGVLTDGTVPLTAFLPTDRAFRNLVADLTGTRYRSEAKVFDALVAAAGVDTIETVLLYHVVPGATITRKDAVKADGAVLTTAMGGTITVDVRAKWLPLVSLVDADTDDRNPWVQRFDINRGNLQIAHGITAVLRPIDL